MARGRVLDIDHLMGSKSEMEAIVSETGWKVEQHFDGPGPVYIAVLSRSDRG